MLTLNQRTSLAFLIVLTSTLLCPFAIANELKSESAQFNYIRGDENGPTKWGEMKTEWAECNNGRMQSPIDLSSKRVNVVKSLGQLKNNYKPSTAILKNRGHDVLVSWEGNVGSIEINGTQYHLQQVHWHTPSEHTLNGGRYDLELHMVHGSSNPNVKYPLAVVSFLYKIGLPDPFLSKVSREIKALKERKEIKLGSINPNEIRMGEINYYRYIGSLTVPPCTEGVIWNINKQIGTVSLEQVKLLSSVVHASAEKNARPIQQDNGREVDFYSS